MKKVVPTFVFIIILSMVASTMVLAGRHRICKLHGSWIGYDDSGSYWLATYHGKTAFSGTSDLDFPLFEPTLGGLFPEAVKVSSARGVWERTGVNTFAYTLILFGIDGNGAVSWILKNSGDKTLTENCSLMSIKSSIEVFLPDVDPFDGEPIICIPPPPEPTSWEVRMRVDPPCSTE
jgi:hypothetical protein